MVPSPTERRREGRCTYPRSQTPPRESGDVMIVGPDREPPDEAEETSRRPVVRAAGGLVKMSTRASRRRPARSQRSALRDRKRFPRGHREKCLDARGTRGPPRPVSHLRAPQDTETGRLHAQETVLRDFEVGRERELLVNHRNPGLERCSPGLEAGKVRRRAGSLPRPARRLLRGASIRVTARAVLSPRARPLPGRPRSRLRRRRGSIRIS